jgi:hypothetical protein
MIIWWAQEAVAAGPPAQQQQQTVVDNEEAVLDRAGAAHLPRPAEAVALRGLMADAAAGRPVDYGLAPLATRLRCLIVMRFSRAQARRAPRGFRRRQVDLPGRPGAVRGPHPTTSFSGLVRPVDRLRPSDRGARRRELRAQGEFDLVVTAFVGATDGSTELFWVLQASHTTESVPFRL